jgi:uncharacterized protein YeeX (DUF496 family)
VKLQLLMMLIGNLFKIISPDMVRDGVSRIIDLVEASIAKSENKIDDAIAIPLVIMIRQSLSIPDKDGSPLVAAQLDGKLGMIVMLLTNLLGIVTPDMLKSAIDSVLDVVENAIASTETKTDDAVLLPLVTLVRTTFDIPDRDPVPVVQ